MTTREWALCRRSSERARPSVVAFLEAALAHYKALGVTIKRLITDNGPVFRSKLFVGYLPSPSYQAHVHWSISLTNQWQGQRFIQTRLH